MQQFLSLMQRLLALMRSFQIIMREGLSLMESFDVLTQSILILLSLYDTLSGPRVYDLALPFDSCPHRSTPSCFCRPTLRLTGPRPTNIDFRNRADRGAG